MFTTTRPRSLLTRATATAAMSALAITGMALFELQSRSTPASAAVVLEGGQPLSPGSSMTPDPTTTLWYDTPATSWENQSLPIGNGDQGASIFGGVSEERLTLNEHSLWTGGPGSRDGYNFGNWAGPRPGALDGVRDKLDEQGSMSPEEVAAILGNPSYFNGGPGRIPGFGAYQVFGNMFLEVPGASEYTDYRRSLDIGSAVSSVRYKTTSGATITREYLASTPDNVIAFRLTADQSGQIAFKTRFESPHSPQVTAGNDGQITVKGSLAENGMKYELQAKVVADGGTLGANAGQVTVSGANSATIFLTMGTDYAADYPTYRGVDPHDQAVADVTAAVAKGYDAVRATHVDHYREQFNRVSLDLGGVPPTDPTNVVLADYSGGSSPQDRWLESLYFAFGRYLLISSSQPGGLPANLQGVWNDSTSPAWEADYHTNINVQMNYWPAEVTGLSDSAEPLIDFVQGLVEPGRETARSMFGTDGWIVQQNTNVFGFTGVHDWPTSFWMPEAAAWLMQPIYEHYQFTGDKDYLANRAYPMMKEATEFWLQNLREDPRDGKLVVTPSFSPEQGPFTAGAAMPEQIVANLLSSTIDATKELGVDPEFRARVEDALGRMDPGLAIGSWGQIKEWKTEESLDNQWNTHRHVSQLFALYPGNAIDVRNEPALAQAAKTVLNARTDGGTGWSKAWKVNFWARLLDGDRAQSVLAGQLKDSTLDNLWDTHPPFQIDGNFGGTSGIAEMLLQSQHNEIDVLPARPSVWANGSYENLVARGGAKVSAKWAGGATQLVKVAPKAAGPVTVRSDLFNGGFSAVDETTGATIAAQPTAGVLTFEAVAGHVYRFAVPASLELGGAEYVQAGAGGVTTATVQALGGNLAPGLLKLTAPDGWLVSPQSVRIGETTAGSAQPVEFTAWSPTGARGDATLTATFQPDSGPTLTQQRTVKVTEGIQCDGMSVVAYSSQETAQEDRPARNLVDCQVEPGWHTQWSSNSTPPPHWAVIDLGSVYPVAAASCVPRAAENGRIKDIRFETSLDGTTWTQSAEASFPNDTSARTVALNGSNARYVRMTGLSSFDGNWISCGEFTATAVAVGTPTAPVVTSPANGATVSPNTPFDVAGTADPGATVLISDPSGAVKQSALTGQNGQWTARIDGLPAGNHALQVLASLNRGAKATSLNLVMAAAPALDVTASAAGKCVANKAVLTVLATNRSSVPVTFRFDSAYGTKVIASVAPGKNATHAFTTRLGTLPAGSVTVTATATLGGVPVSQASVVPYEARNCGN
ncbi:glycosyl hydrolase family 95 catalytic domain-containing protein [Paenarthrobacter sp. NPDC092416]|uniref:glycosyl hydrolase family 95 catalytic domain-containing protein n=1 Tax=Paenarthrobacter sp. NPDC092416 TaxID=3364386 RepID=UPI003822B93C